ncbi:MAG: flagellar hook-length control protein FliK [Geminicoccaceae bacterium]
MNGPNPIFPLAGTGQTASAQTAQPSESENTVFAENLTAALAAPSLTLATSIQQKAETPIASFQGGLVDGSLEAALSAADKPVLDDVVQSAGLIRPVGHADISTASSTDIGAQAGSPGSTTAHDGSPSEVDLRTIGIVNAANKVIPAADAERVPAGVDVARQDRSPTTTSSLPDMQHSDLVSLNVATMRPSGDAALDQRVANDGDGLVPASPIGFQDRQTLIMPGGREVSPMEEPSKLAAHVPGKNAQNTGAGLIDMLPSEEPLANASLDGEMRLARPALAIPTIAEETQARATPSSASEAGLQTVAQRMSLLSEKPLQLQPVVDRAVRPDSGTSLQIEAPSLLASRAGVVLSAQRPSTSARSYEASHHLTRSPAPTANPSGLSESRSLAGRPTPHSVSVSEAAVNPELVVTPGAAARTMVADGSLRPNTELGGFDRLQPALSAEGAPLDNLRFEAASNLGQSRAQASLAHAPASAQIALQIVRSLPEGVDRFSVHLQPVELGSIDIQLNFEGGGRLSALITAERPETLELLQRDSRILERSLGDSGLKLASDGLSFALKQDHSQQHGQGFHEQAQARQTAFRAGRAYDDTPDTEQAPLAMKVDGVRLLDIET